MNIDGNNNFPQSGDELHNYLKNGDSISFIIKKKQAQFFKRQAKRIIQAENFLKNRRGFYSRLKSSLYMIYVGLINYWLTTKHKELDYPLLVYTTSWRYIVTIGGEDMTKGMAKITFFGGRLKPKGTKKV